MHTYKVTLEVRQAGAIGAYSAATYTVEASSLYEATRAASEQAQAEGLDVGTPRSAVRK